MDVIAACCREKDTLSLSFVERDTDTIRSVRRRTLGLRDEEHLRLKVFTCMLPES